MTDNETGNGTATNTRIDSTPSTLTLDLGALTQGSRVQIHPRLLGSAQHRLSGLDFHPPPVPQLTITPPSPLHTPLPSH